ncbi:hypothetical protein PV410_32650 [Streptomyces sp. PA03-5A]|nr:hypothetical protein [Streptomyces sp. PA03-5A]
MPRPSDWNVLGLHGDPTPGDPVQIRLLVDDLVKIGTQARSIAQAIDQVMNTADSSVFAGKTADALRGKVDDRLRNHINDVADSFWEVSQNLGAWANHIEDAQRRADGALSAARGLPEDDPQLEALRQTAQSAGTELDEVGNTIANAVNNASDIRLPISDCQVFWEMFQILAIILIVPALIFGGPVALLALGVNMTLFVKAAIDFARGDIGFLDLFLAGLGIIAPTTKALPIFAIGGLLKSGFKAALQWGRNGFMSIKDMVSGFRFATVFTGLRDVARISLTWVRQGGLWVMQNFHNVPALGGSVFVKGGLVVVQGVRSIPVVVRGWGSAIRAGAPGAWQNFRLFAQETWSSQMAGGKWTRLILPVTHTDIAEYGLKGALRMGFWDRGVMGRGVWDLPVGGTVAHTVSAVPMGPHGATPHLDLGHANINMARMDLADVRFGNFGDTHTSVRPSSFSVAPVSTVDLTGLRVGTVNPVSVHGANAVFDNSTAGFRAVRHMDDVVDIAGTQMSRMRIDALDGAPGQMSGGLGVSSMAPGGHVTHSSGLYVPGSAGAPVVHEGVDVAALVAKGNGGNLLAQGPAGVLTAPPGGTGAVHTALTGAPAPAPGGTALHDLLAAPGAPGAGTGAAHTALTGVQAPPSGAGVHDLLGAPGGTPGAHGPLTGVPGHQSGTGAAGGSAFDLLSGGAKGTPNNPVPTHIGSDLGDNVAGAARANQAHLSLDEIVRPAGSGRPGSVVTDTVPGPTTPGVPASGVPKGGVHGTPPKDAARSALDLLDDGRGVRSVDGPALAGAPGTGAGKTVNVDAGHAFAGAPARHTDDVVTPAPHDKVAVTGDGHVAVPLRQDPAPVPPATSGGGRVHSHQAELFHEVNLKLGKMGADAVTVETVTAARQVLEDLRGAAFTKVDVRAQADQLAVHLAGPERGKLPGGVRDTDFADDAPVTPGPGGHHAPPVPPRPESGLLDGLDDLVLDDTGAPMRSHFDMDDDSLPGSPVGEHGTEDLDGFSEFVDLIRPLRQHVERAFDNPAADIEVALVASPGGRTWREFSDDVGHAMVSVMLPGERKPLTIGFYPEDGNLFGNPGAIVNDAEYLLSGHVRVLGTYRITAAQLFDGYRYAMANSGAVYDLFRYNCVRFAEGFVSAALGKSVADLWVAAPYRLVDTMLRRDGAWHWADGTSPVAKLTADDTIRYQDAFGEVEDWRLHDQGRFQAATDQAKTFVLFDHQRPLIDGNLATAPQKERLLILDQFEKMITHTILTSGDDAGRQLSRQLGETYGTLRPGLSDLPGPSVTAPAAGDSLSGIGRGSVDSVPEPAPSPGTSAAGDSTGHLPPSSVQYPSDVQHMFDEIDDMLDDMGVFRHSVDDLPAGSPPVVHGAGGDDVARFMDDTRPVRQHLEHAIADPAADIRLVLGTDGSTGARSLTVWLPGRDAPVPLGPGAPGEFGAVRGTVDGAPGGGTHVLEEHRLTAAQLENAYLYAARNLPLWHTDAGRFTDGFMDAVLDARPAAPEGSVGAAVHDVPDTPPAVGDKGKGKSPTGTGTLDTTGTGSHHDGLRADLGDDLSDIDASAAITDARRELINARTIRDDLQTRYVEGFGTSAEADGFRYLESWQHVRQADAALAQAEAHWSDVTGGAPFPEVQAYRGYGLGGAAPHLPEGLRSLFRGRGRADVVPPAPEGVVQSVDHVPSATHVVTPLEGGKTSHALVPSGQDLTVARWISEPESAKGWPGGNGREAYEGDLTAHQDILAKGLAGAEHDDALKSVLVQQQKSFEENVQLFHALEGRPELANLRMPQLSAIVMAERRALRTLTADTDLLTQKLNSGDWKWAEGYPLDGAQAHELIAKVHRHLQEDLSLTVNLKLGDITPAGGTLLDALTSDTQLLRNAWEANNANAGYYVTRGKTEEALGLPASVKRTTEASGIYPGAQGRPFAPTADDLVDLPNYAALTSKYRPSGVKMYGRAVFHLNPDVMQRATFTPADSFIEGLEGARSVTGRGNMLPLLNHGPEPLVRLAFAEATDFRYDGAFRGFRDAGTLERNLGRYFEAQIHGGVKWDDLNRVVLVDDGFDPALQAQKLQLEQFAQANGHSFTVEIHNARPGAGRAPGVHPAPPGTGGAHSGGPGPSSSGAGGGHLPGPGPSPSHVPAPASAPGEGAAGGAVDGVHASYDDLVFTASLLDRDGVPRDGLFTGTAARVEGSGDASFVSPAAPSASGGITKLTEDGILDVVIGTGGRNGGEERRTLGGFEFGAGTRNNNGKNLVSRPIVVTVKDGETEAQVAVHLNVMLSSGNEADVTLAGKKVANTTEVTITGSKFHLTARPHTDQGVIDLHGASSDTASKSIHVGPSNALSSGWNSRPGNTRNLAQALGVSEQKLIDALDNRFPPSGLVETVHRFQDDVERAVVHGSGAEEVRVHFQGDKSFPVRGDSGGVSAPAVTGLSGGAGDVLHGAGSGAGRVDLTLDAGWDAARGAAAPNTVKHSWVDPVSTPRGGGAHAPRYEVRAGYDVRRFELGGRPVTDLTVKVRLAGDGLSPNQVDALWDRAVSGVERVFNRPGEVLRDRSVLHVTLERVTGNASDAHLNVNVGGARGAMNQHQWRIDATEQDLAHELGHQLGLRDEYRDTTAGHRPEVDGSLMGNYHNAAPEGLSQGGLRPRYLDLIHAQVAGHDHVHVPHVAVDAVGGIAPHAPKKAKPNPSQPAAVPPTFTRQTDATRFTEGYQKIAGHYQLKPLAQYDGMAKGSLQAGDGTRFVATVIATPDTDLLKLAQTYGTAFGKESLGERLGLVIGVNGRAGTETAIADTVRKFAQAWEKEGDFAVSVTGYTWHQPNPRLVDAGTQKEIPYGALREAVIRDDLTRGMLDKVRLNAGGEVYLHVGDADVKSLVVGGKPLFERAAAKIESLSTENGLAPEMVSGGYTLPEGVAKNAADLDLAVRDAMAKTDARTIYFPEPNTFIRVDTANSLGLEKDIRFGEISGDTISYEAREGERLLDSLVKNRRHLWQGRENQAVVFDSGLALVTDGDRIAKEVGNDPRSILNGLTQSHANAKTWTEQIEHYLKLHHPDVLVKDANAGKSLAAIAFHKIEADGATTLTKLEVKDLGTNRKAEWKALIKATGDDKATFKQLIDVAVDTRNALVDGINKHLPQSVSAAAPAASGSARLTGDGVLDAIVGRGGGRPGDERRVLGGFEFGVKTRNNGGNNLISRPIVITVTDGGTEAEVAVHLNVVLTSSHETRVAGGSSVTISGSDFHLTARSKAAQDLIDEHGPSILTADNSIHVGPNNATRGWKNNSGHTQNLADELGVSKDSLLDALDRRFPPDGLLDTLERLQRDVRHTVVHGSATENVTVRWESGDRSFPVLDDPAGVSARAVSAPAGAVDDFFHGAGSGARRVDLTLDAGWDAARGAAAPNTVKHSWVDPVSTPRGGGAHAPRYEVRAGYDVRRFELGDRSVTDLTVKVRLADEGLSPTEVDALWDRAVSGVERVFNRPGEVLRDGSVLHVTLERVTGNASDAHLNVNVGRAQSAMNQHQWRIDATEQDLAHELGHQLGLRDEYRDTTAGHRPEVDGSLMGNYHNAAPEGLSQGGLRPRYLDFIHAQVASHDHVHVPHVDVDAVDGVAPHAPSKAKVKANTSQAAVDPATFTRRTDAVRFTKGFSDIVENYRLTPVAQYDGTAKGSLRGGEGTRFVATVIATPDTDLLKLAQTYGTAFGKESLGERLGLVIGVNGQVGKDADIVDTVRKFAQQWEKEGDFAVSVSGFTWEQRNPQLLKDGGQKMVPFGALREAVIRDDLTRGMFDKLEVNAKGGVYLHVGDADVKSMVVGGKPLFERAAAKIESLSAENGLAPEMVSGGYTLPGGVAKNAADLDMAVRDAMARTDTRAVYFPEPNTFVRVDPELGLEKDIRFGEVFGKAVSYEAREGERLLDSSLKNRGYLWQGRENQGFVFDSDLALVTDGERIAKEVGDDPRSILSGLTQSHANSKTWTEQIERYIKLHHPDVLVKDANVGKSLAAIAFHDIRADGITALKSMSRKELGKALPAEASAIMKVADDFPAPVKKLLDMAVDTRNALVDGLNKQLPQSVSPSAPSASTSTAAHAGAGTGGGRLTPDAVRILDSITGSSTVDGSRRTLGGFEFGRVRDTGSTNLISRPVLMTVTEGDKSVQVAVHLNVMVTPSGRLDGTTVTLNTTDFHLTARSKAAQVLIDKSGPSALTADNSIHVGPSNAKTGWDNRGGQLKNLADELGITKDSLVKALDSRFPPGELLDTVALFQRDVERAIVHASASEVITVEFRGDKSFPVRSDSNGVSPRSVSVPAGVVDDVFHGAVPGAGRVDLTLDPGWDAARGASVPNTVKHSWVDPVSTPRGGGAHAPRYEVRAGYDVRRFELGDRSVTDLTVKVRLADDGLSATQVDALWDRALVGVERVFNRPGETLRDGSVLHVTLERVTGNASDAHLNVRVGGPDGAMNQHQWRIDATEQDLAHELGHQLGLRDEYRDTTAGHRPEVDGSLMGNYHNAAPEGLSQGGLRPRYLDLIHAQVVSHDHVHVPHVDVDAVDGIAPHAPDGKAKGKAKASTSASTSQLGPVPPTFTERADVLRFSEGYGDIASHYRLTPVAQFDGAAKGALQGGEGTRFVATVIATPDTDLLKLAKMYGTAFGDKSVLGERLGLVIGVNGRAGSETAIADAVRKFARQWAQEGDFEVSVTGFTWRQPNPRLVDAGTQKEIPYGALREAVVRDDLTRGMLDKVKLNARGEVYLHVGDADVKSMVVGGKPLFDRAAVRIETLTARNGNAPEMVSGGYTLPEGATPKAKADRAAAEIDLAVRDVMAKFDSRTVYFPEPNSFVRVNPDAPLGLEGNIRFGKAGDIVYEAEEGRHLLDSVFKNRQFLGWQGREDKLVSFDSSLALVTDGGRIADKVRPDVPSTVLDGLTQSHADRGTWTKQVERYLAQYHGGVLTKDPNVGRDLAAFAFHGIQTDDTTLLKAMTRQELGKALPAEADALMEVAKDFPKTLKRLLDMAVDTRNALIGGIKTHVPQSVSAAAPAASGSARLTGDGVLDAIVGRGGGRPEDARRTLGGFEFGVKTRNNGGNNLISRPIVITVTDGGTQAEVAVHLNVVLTSSHETRVAGGSSVTISGSDFHLTARSKAAQDLIDEHGPSILTADNSIHVGPNNATRGWKNNSGHTQNLADELGVSKDSLLDALDRRFPPDGLLDTLERLQRDVRHTVVHGSATENVTVRWESGDRSFPVLDDPAGVSARAVSAPAGAADDFLHGAGDGHVDLTLDPGWGAARGAAAPNTVKHSWVDPVSTPRGGGAHAPRYEVRAGFDVRTFPLGERSVTDLTVRVQLAADGLSPAQVNALWERALGGVERVFNRPGEVLGDGSVLHVTLERVTGNAADAHLNVRVGGPDGAMNQHQWRIDATEQDLAHELGHQLGLRDEYRDLTAGHRPEVDGSLMGNYHNAAPEGLTQGGLRSRYLELIHAQVRNHGHDHVHVPHTRAVTDDAVAPPAPGKGKGRADEDAGSLDEGPDLTPRADDPLTTADAEAAVQDARRDLNRAHAEFRRLEALDLVGRGSSNRTGLDVAREQVVTAEVRLAEAEAAELRVAAAEHASPAPVPSVPPVPPVPPVPHAHDGTPGSGPASSLRDTDSLSGTETFPTAHGYFSELTEPHPRQIDEVDGTFTRYDEHGAPVATGRPLPALPGVPDGLNLVTPAQGAAWLEDATGTRIAHFRGQEVTATADGLRVTHVHTGGPRDGEFIQIGTDGTLVKQGFNVLDKGRPTAYQYVLDHPNGVWERTGPDGAGAGVFHHGKADLTGAANGRVVLLSDTGAPVPVFERRPLPGGGLLDSFRRTDTIDFGRMNPRTSWARWGDDATLSGAGIREYDTAGTGWRDLDARGNVVHEYQAGLQKHGNGTGHTLALGNEDGRLRWHRYDGASRELAAGPRTPDRYDSGWTDLADDGRTLVQRKWGMGHLPEHAGQYEEHTLVQDAAAPGGWKTDGTWQRQSPHGKAVGKAEVVDGHLLVTERWREQRPPVWVRKGLLPGAGHAEGAYAHVLGDNAYQLFTWEKRRVGDGAGSGTSGVRYVGLDGGTLDLAANGDFARLTTKLHDGTTLKVGDHAGGPGYPPADASYVPWEDSGGRHGYRVPQQGAPDGPLWQDRFQGPDGRLRVAREGLPDGVVREYVDAPVVGHPSGRGSWVTRDAHGNLTGMRHPNPNGAANSFIEGTGRADSAKWTWRETDAQGNHLGRSGSREFFRGSNDPRRSWDDSFRDLDANRNLVRERRMLDKGRFVDAWRDPARNERWLTAEFQRDGSPATAPGQGGQVRTWWNRATGTWDDQWRPGARHFRDELRSADGTRVVLRDTPLHLDGPARVREYGRTAGEPGAVWKEFDHGSVVRERTAETGPGGTVTGYLETDAWRGQWNRYDARGELVAQRTDSGLVWERRGPLGQMKLVGNEYDYRGPLTEIRGWGRRIRESQRMPWSGTMLPDGAGTALREARYEPYWRTVAYKAAVEFGQEFVLEFGANLAVNGIVAAAQDKPFTGKDVLKAFANAAVSSGVKTGFGIAVHENRAAGFRELGNLKATLANIDGGKHPQRRPFNHDKTWSNEWAGNETPTRWRGGIYDFTFSAGTSVISGWVNGAMNAAVWGVSDANGNTVKLSGADAFLDGGINAAAALTTSASTALVKNVLVLGGGSRLFHRQGFADFWIQLPFKIFEKSIQSVYLTGAYRASINPSWYQVPPPGTQQQ